MTLLQTTVNFQGSKAPTGIAENAGEFNLLVWELLLILFPEINPRCDFHTIVKRKNKDELISISNSKDLLNYLLETYRFCLSSINKGDPIDYLEKEITKIINTFDSIDELKVLKKSPFSKCNFNKFS